jgi:hypothetical protein
VLHTHVPCLQGVSVRVSVSAWAVRVCVRARVRACVRACVHVCVRALPPRPFCE